MPRQESAFATAPMTDVLDVLLRQLKRPLAGVGFALSTEEPAALAAMMLESAPPDAARLNALTVALRAIVAESASWFGAQGLTFEQSLQTDMGTLGGWETTADFLELANIKSNHELRTSTAAAVLAVLGDVASVRLLLFLVEHPQLDDVAALMARRVLAFCTHTEATPADAAWRAAVRKYYGLG